MNPRDLTKKEQAAVDRLEKALAAIPDTLAIYFNSEGTAMVFDKETWNRGPGRGEGWSQWANNNSIGSASIACRYDVGAL